MLKLIAKTKFFSLDGHIRLVQRQIGRKPGTGGTAGYGYLLQTLS